MEQKLQEVLTVLTCLDSRTHITSANFFFSFPARCKPTDSILLEVVYAFVKTMTNFSTSDLKL